MLEVVDVFGDVGRMAHGSPPTEYWGKGQFEL